MDIAIIGAGIVGLTTAWRLHAAGHRVTIFETCEEPACLSSRHSGGQLRFFTLAPVADRRFTLFSLPDWINAYDSPIYWRPQRGDGQWRWLRAFLRASRKRQRQESLEALQELAALSHELTEKLHELPGVQSHWKRCGRIVLYRNPRRFEAARRAAEHSFQLREHMQTLSAAECVEEAPLLADMIKHFVGGIYSPDECVLDAPLLCRTLSAHLLTKAPEVRIMYGLKALSLDARNGRIVAVDTEEARFAIDAVVLACGVQTQPLLYRLGVSLPLYPITGYQLSIAQVADAPPLNVAISDAEAHFHLSGLEGQIHASGLFDIAAPREFPSAARVEHLRRRASAFTGKHWPLDAPEVFMNVCAATPNGCPIIGRQPEFTNLWLNLGHGQLGLTLAAGAAELLACQMSDKPILCNETPFAPSAMGEA